MGPAIAAPASDARPRLVVVDNRLEAGERELLERSLRELLLRIDAQLVVDAPPGDESVLARVLIQPSRDAALVTVRGGAHSILLDRREVAAGSDELTREAVAHVVLGAIEPLRVEPRPFEPELASSGVDPGLEGDETEWTSGFFVSVGGGPARLGRGLLAPAFALGLERAYPGRFRPTWSLQVRSWLPVSFEVRGTSMDLSRFGGRATARVDALRGEWLAVELGLAAALDALSIDPRLVSAPLESTGRSTRLQPSVGGFVGGSARLSARLELSVAVGADLELAPRRWLAVSEGERVSLFETQRWLSHVALGLRYALGEAARP